jgi:hypothetical protein
MPISLDPAIIQAGHCYRSACRDETIILCLTPPDNGHSVHHSQGLSSPGRRASRALAPPPLWQERPA